MQNHTKNTQLHFTSNINPANLLFLQHSILDETLLISFLHFLPGNMIIIGEYVFYVFSSCCCCCYFLSPFCVCESNKNIRVDGRDKTFCCHRIPIRSSSKFSSSSQSLLLLLSLPCHRHRHPRPPLPAIISYHNIHIIPSKIYPFSGGIIWIRFFVRYVNERYVFPFNKPFPLCRSIFICCVCHLRLMPPGILIIIISKKAEPQTSKALIIIALRIWKMWKADNRNNNIQYCMYSGSTSEKR